MVQRGTNNKTSINFIFSTNRKRKKNTTLKQHTHTHTQHTNTFTKKMRTHYLIKTKGHEEKEKATEQQR